MKGRASKKASKNHEISIKSEGVPKTCQKGFQKLILGSMLDAKTPPKSTKNRIKNDVKKTIQKNVQKSANKSPIEKPVLAWNGKSEDILE